MPSPHANELIISTSQLLVQETTIAMYRSPDQSVPAHPNIYVFLIFFGVPYVNFFFLTDKSTGRGWSINFLVKSTKIIGFFEAFRDEESVLLDSCTLVTLADTQRLQLLASGYLIGLSTMLSKYNPGGVRLIFSEVAYFQPKSWFMKPEENLTKKYQPCVLVTLCSTSHIIIKCWLHLLNVQRVSDIWVTNELVGMVKSV